MDPNQDRKGKGPMIEPSREEIIQARRQALGGVTIRGDQPARASRPLPRPPPPSPRASSSSTSHEVGSQVSIPKSSGPMGIASVTTSRDLRNIRAQFKVPNDIHLSVALPEDRVTSTRPGKVALYEEFFKGGLRLPLHPFFVNLLNRYRLAPAQLTPNSIRVIFSFLVLCHFHGASARLSLFRALYRIRNPVRDGWWSFASRPRRVLKLNLPSKIKGWKPKFFYAHIEGVNTNWGVPDTSANQNPVIEVGDQELFKALMTTVAPPNKELLSDDNLRGITFMPVSLPTAPAMKFSPDLIMAGLRKRKENAPDTSGVGPKRSRWEELSPPVPPVADLPETILVEDDGGEKDPPAGVPIGRPPCRISPAALSPLAEDIGGPSKSRKATSAETSVSTESVGGILPGP